MFIAYLLSLQVSPETQLKLFVAHCNDAAQTMGRPVPPEGPQNVLLASAVEEPSIPTVIAMPIAKPKKPWMIFWLLVM